MKTKLGKPAGQQQRGEDYRKVAKSDPSRSILSGQCYIDLDNGEKSLRKQKGRSWGTRTYSVLFCTVKGCGGVAWARLVPELPILLPSFDPSISSIPIRMEQ